MHFRMFGKSDTPSASINIRPFAELARDQIHQLGLGHVIGGIISPVHDAYKKEGLESSAHRLAMVKLGLQSSDWIKLSDWECQQEDWTRTRQVLQYHLNKLNVSSDVNGNVPWLPNNFTATDQGNQGVQLKFLCGADLLESFAKPGLWKEEDLNVILGQHGLVVVSRSGSNPEKFIFDSDQLTRFRVT